MIVSEKTLVRKQGVVGALMKHERHTHIFSFQVLKKVDVA